MTPSTELTGAGQIGLALLIVTGMWSLYQLVRLCRELRSETVLVRRRRIPVPPAGSDGDTPHPCRHVTNVRPMRRPYDWNRQ